MRPTFAALSKASRRPLNPKRGNKDYYKGASSELVFPFVHLQMQFLQVHDRPSSQVDCEQARQVNTSVARRLATVSWTKKCASSSPHQSRRSSIHGFVSTCLVFLFPDAHDSLSDEALRCMRYTYDRTGIGGSTIWQDSSRRIDWATLLGLVGTITKPRRSFNITIRPHATAFLLSFGAPKPACLQLLNSKPQCFAKVNIRTEI